jgi:hypothetical protein
MVHVRRYIGVTTRRFARAASLQVPSSLELLFLTTSLRVLDR